MKRRILFALTAILIIGLSSCGGQNLKNELRPTPNQDAAIENRSREESEGASIASEEQDYSGFYADTQETSSVYSELELLYQGNGSYKATIGLHRLTTFQGTAMVDGENLLFENDDDDTRVKGKISLQDDGAIFTITESDFTYTAPGDVFQFPIKIADLKPGYSIEDAGTFDGELYSGMVFFLRSETDESDMYWQIPVFANGQYLTTLKISSEEHGDAFPSASQLVTQVDVDFDGQADLLLGLGHFGAQGALGLKCYLTREGTLVACPSFGDIANPALDMAEKAVLSSWRNSAASYGWGIWHFQDDFFVMTEELTVEPLAEQLAEDGLVWTERALVNGEWRVEHTWSTAEVDADSIDVQIMGPNSHWGILQPKWNKLIGTY